MKLMRLVVLVAALIALRPHGLEAQVRVSIPTEVNGVEITGVKGWLANRNPWRYVPEWSTVHPVSWLQTPYEFPTEAQVEEQNRLLNQGGSGADVLSYNPNPDYPDHNQWMRTIFHSCGRPGRAFLLLWEHVHGTRYEPSDGAKNMSLAVNRQRFEEDLDFMFREVIMRCEGRYVTWDKKAVIFLWSMGDMYGDVASLLDMMRAKYPVVFIGAVNVLHFASKGPDELANIRALDGFMEYSLYPVLATPEELVAKSISYERMVRMHSTGIFLLHLKILEWEKATRKRYLLVSTFQFAFDDTKYPTRLGVNQPMYPPSQKVLEDFASSIARSEKSGVYISIGPFVVWDELFEGAAAIPSQCTPETADTPTRFVGCGFYRLQLLKKYFGP